MNAPKILSWALLGGVVALSAGCDGEPSSPNDVNAAAAIAKEIKAAPDDAEKILEKHDMTEASFEALMFEIAEDPEKSKAFTEASK